MIEKLKSLIQNDQVFYSFLIILVGITSFGLGRMSAEESALALSTPRVELIEPVLFDNTAKPSTEQIKPQSKSPESMQINSEQIGQTTAIVVVGSRTGARYHLPSCPGAKQIKPENLVTFSSVKQAEAAGYTPAANCAGL
jgi:hypothetical protein